MIQNLLANWKTTYSGLTLIIGDVVHLVFGVLHGKADENMWTISLIGILGGIGLIFAGDASTSQQAIAKVDTKVEQNAAAITTGDTTVLDARRVMPPSA